jgi:septal ring factor EnvC (AmiA/AmiB activator)
MKENTLRLFIKTALLIAVLTACAFAQNSQDSEQRAEGLRSQLRGVVDKEAELRSRLEQIEDDLKPENIQRSTALIGTTRPAELREQRRLQLEKDRANVQAQLEELGRSRARIEEAVASAEAEADRERMNAATPAAAPAPTVTNAAPARPQTQTQPGPAAKSPARAQKKIRRKGSRRARRTRP